MSPGSASGAGGSDTPSAPLSRGATQGWLSRGPRWSISISPLARSGRPRRAAARRRAARARGHTGGRRYCAWVVASLPNTAGLYRFDQLIAALVRNSLWLTDAYFAGATSYVQALRSAAQDGVDVRLLVPGSTDIPIFRAVSRASYYSLLEAGVRVFEWNGPMMHAKTAVADGRWARVGSTNLNVASWMGNYELDVAVEDEGFAEAMEAMYLEDLANSTEIVLGARGVRTVGCRPIWSVKQRKRRSGRVTRAGAGAIRIGSAVGAAITNRRVLGPTEAKIMGVLGALLLGLSAVFALWPKWIGIPIALFGAWFAVSLLVRAYKLYVSRRRESRCRRAGRG